MTNKKLKLAAMSVALTACVAAQPMAAHAVEGPDSAEDNAAPQAEPAPVEGETAEGEVEGEEEKQEEFVPPVNEEAKSEEQAPAFGPGTKTDDITIDYKPAEKPEEPGETDEPETPGDTHLKGDVIDNNKKDEATGKDGKIGEATKEETPDSSSSTTVVDPDAEVKKGDPVVGKDEDGNTTITTPTETTGTELRPPPAPARPIPPPPSPTPRRAKRSTSTTSLARTCVRTGKPIRMTSWAVTPWTRSSPPRTATPRS